MFDFIKLQYQMGHIDKHQVELFVGRWITEDEAKRIIGGE